MDRLICGGIVRGSTILVSGRTGTGKTTFGLQFLFNGAQQFNEPGILITLESRPDEIRRNALQFGWDFQSLETSGLLSVIDAASSRAGLPTSEKRALRRGFDTTTLAEEIYDCVNDTGAKRLVIDSIAALGIRFDEPSEVRSSLFRLSALLRELRVTSLFVGEAGNPSSHSRAGVEEFVAQGLILLDLREVGGELERGIVIWKMHRTQHSLRRHRFIIDSTGIRIVD